MAVNESTMNEDTNIPEICLGLTAMKVELARVYSSCSRR